MSVCHVAETASDKVPNAITTAGSMSTELYGMAVLDACRQLVHRLQPLPAAPAAERSRDRSIAIIRHGLWQVPMLPRLRRSVAKRAAAHDAPQASSDRSDGRG